MKRLDLTAIVYVLFLALCLAGVAAWRRALHTAVTGDVMAVSA